MGPRVVVLYGGYAFERVRNLLNGMVNVPLDLTDYGRVMVDLMCGPSNATHTQQADLVQSYLRQFKLSDHEDPGFDERIMFEALMYGGRMFRAAWLEQVPNLSYEDYRFSRWLGMDLVLERMVERG